MHMPTRLWDRHWLIMAKFDELKSLLEKNLVTIEPFTDIRKDWQGNPSVKETIQESILGTTCDISSDTESDSDHGDHEAAVG